jgi:hypothetical protein
VDESEDGRAAIVAHRQRLIDDAEPDQGAVDDPLFGQDQQPAIGADDVGGPERQHGQDQGETLPPFGHPVGDDIGQRIGEDDADDGGEEGDLDRIGQPLDHIVAAEEFLVVDQGQRLVELATDPLPEAPQQHDPERDDEEDHRPDQGRQDGPFGQV